MQHILSSSWDIYFSLQILVYRGHVQTLLSLFRHTQPPRLSEVSVQSMILDRAKTDVETLRSVSSPQARSALLRSVNVSHAQSAPLDSVNVSHAHSAPLKSVNVSHAHSALS